MTLRPYRAAFLKAATVATIAIATVATARDTTPPPAPARFLVWTPAEQEFGYRNIEKSFPTHVARRGPRVYPLPVAAQPIAPSFTFEGKEIGVDDYVALNKVAGLLVIKDGKIVLEKYGLGEKPGNRWTSFSVGKSVTSTLLGAAIKDGYIGSVTEPVTKYIPELAGSAYDGVSIADALKMRSGVQWNEDYQDPKSDVGRLATSMALNRGDSLVALMKTLPREAAPGTKFVYKTGESNLIGVIVTRATHKPLAQYLSEKIWAPFGMEQDALWMTDGGTEIGGCCISMTLRDYGRFGEFFMRGGRIGDKEVLPPDWTVEATKIYTPNTFGPIGYGYQWWPHPDGTYEAIGIFGQSIFIDPKNKLVVVTSSAWPEAGWKIGYARKYAFLAAVRKAVAAPAS